MFKIENGLMEKINNKITDFPLENSFEIVAKSCGATCNGNCDENIKKKPH